MLRHGNLLSTPAESTLSTFSSASADSPEIPRPCASFNPSHIHAAHSARGGASVTSPHSTRPGLESYRPGHQI
ncbi:hypothetical protein BDV10DRAFT_180024 [Aspergillus recurvatus]